LLRWVFGRFRNCAKDLRMSSDQVAIKVDGLSKCYHIYNQPQDRLKQAVLPRLQKLSGVAP
jgi:lipopolysaccharide transport system ATP-binding protein